MRDVQQNVNYFLKTSIENFAVEHFFKMDASILYAHDGSSAPLKMKVWTMSGQDLKNLKSCYPNLKFKQYLRIGNIKTIFLRLK